MDNQVEAFKRGADDFVTSARRKGLLTRGPFKVIAGLRFSVMDGESGDELTVTVGGFLTSPTRWRVHVGGTVGGRSVSKQTGWETGGVTAEEVEERIGEVFEDAWARGTRTGRIAAMAERVATKFDTRKELQKYKQEHDVQQGTKLEVRSEAERKERNKDRAGAAIPSKEEVKALLYEPSGEFHFERKPDGLYLTLYSAKDAHEVFSKRFEGRFEWKDVGGVSGASRFRITRKAGDRAERVAERLLDESSLRNGLPGHPRENGFPGPLERETLFDKIGHGSRVTIVTPHGSKLTGRAVMMGPAGWVLNLGGRYGTPGIASEDNVIAVKG